MLISSDVLLYCWLDFLILCTFLCFLMLHSVTYVIYMFCYFSFYLYILNQTNIIFGFWNFSYEMFAALAIVSFILVHIDSISDNAELILLRLSLILSWYFSCNFGFFDFSQLNHVIFHFYSSFLKFIDSFS